jgi:hypothetical protein
MRCKVVCSFIQPRQNEDGAAYLYFTPVYTGSEENKRFFKYTPGGQISFTVANKEVVEKFEQGKEYYVDFSPAS